VSRANIGSADVLKTFRHSLLKFDDECQRALSAVNSDLGRVLEWLRHEQLFYWKSQLIKLEELVRVKKSEYIRAGHGGTYQRKTSAVEERLALDKAKRMKAHAEEKLQTIKRWANALDQQTRPMLASCARLNNLLSDNTPKAVARLDQMLDSLDDYLRESTGAG